MCDADRLSVKGKTTTVALTRTPLHTIATRSRPRGNSVVFRSGLPHLPLVTSSNLRVSTLARLCSTILSGCSDTQESSPASCAEVHERMSSGCKRLAPRHLPPLASETRAEAWGVNRYVVYCSRGCSLTREASKTESLRSATICTGFPKESGARQCYAFSATPGSCRL